MDVDLAKHLTDEDALVLVDNPRLLPALEAREKRRKQRIRDEGPNPKVDMMDAVALSSLLVLDAVAEDVLSTTEAEAAQLREYLAEINKKVDSARATMPQNRIPPEVYAHIFSFLRKTAPGSIFIAALVCRSWREGALYSSRLWSNIVVHAENPRADQRARFYIERSGEVPLDVTFVQDGSGFFPSSPQWLHIRNSAWRWRSFTIIARNCYTAFPEMRVLLNPWGPTEFRVKILGRCPGRVYTREGVLGFKPVDEHGIQAQVVPAMKTLFLSVFHIPIPGPALFGLTKLHIEDTFCTIRKPAFLPIRGDDIISFLKHCPNLEDFTFDANATVNWFVRNPEDHDEISGEQFILPCLRVLHLDCHISCGANLLSCLRTPALETATLLMRPRREVPRHTPLRDATFSFLRELPSIRTLRLYGYPAVPIVTALAVCTSRVETLHLEQCQDPDTIVEALTVKDTFGCRQEPIWLVPELSKLIIDAVPSLLTHENVYNLLDRHSAYVTTGTPLPLESLIVNNQEMLKHMAPGEMECFESDSVEGFEAVLRLKDILGSFP